MADDPPSPYLTTGIVSLPLNLLKHKRGIEKSALLLTKQGQSMQYGSERHTTWTFLLLSCWIKLTDPATDTVPERAGCSSQNCSLHWSADLRKESFQARRQAGPTEETQKKSQGDSLLPLIYLMESNTSEGKGKAGILESIFGRGQEYGSVKLWKNRAPSHSARG